jgi:stage II sporulation protein AB (anti-sigma F factor)
MQIAENEKIQTLKNQVKLTVLSGSANVALTRVMAAAFAAQVDLTLSEIDEIKVAVSEAVSNAVIHGYGEVSQKAETGGNYIELTMNLYEERLEYIITDYGKGIEDIEAVRRPASSSDPERMGMGFIFMESFMDKLDVKSMPGQGTTVTISKKIKASPEH